MILPCPEVSGECRRRYSIRHLERRSIKEKSILKSVSWRISWRVTLVILCFGLTSLRREYYVRFPWHSYLTLGSCNYLINWNTRWAKLGKSNNSESFCDGKFLQFYGLKGAGESLKEWWGTLNLSFVKVEHCNLESKIHKLLSGALSPQDLAW